MLTNILIQMVMESLIDMMNARISMVIQPRMLRDALISTVMVGQTRLKEPIGIQAIQLSGQIQMETDTVTTQKERTQIHVLQKQAIPSKEVS